MQQQAVSQRDAVYRAEGVCHRSRALPPQPYLAEIGSAWSLADDGTAITRSVTFGSFPRAMRFINALADLAEDEGHHPDFCVSYKRVDLSVSTHAIGGLVRERFHPGSEDQPIAERPLQTVTRLAGTIRWRQMWCRLGASGIATQAVDGVTACHRCCTAGLS